MLTCTRYTPEKDITVTAVNSRDLGSGGVQVSDSRGRVIATLPSLHDLVMCVDISPCGRYFVTCGNEDLKMSVFDNEAPSGTEWIMDIFVPARILCVAFSPDANRLVTGHRDFQVREWNLRTGLQMGWHISNENYVTSVNYNLDGTRIVFGNSDGLIYEWCVDTGVQIGDASLPTGVVPPDEYPYVFHRRAWIISVKYTSGGFIVSKDYHDKDFVKHANEIDATPIPGAAPVPIAPGARDIPDTTADPGTGEAPVPPHY